MPDFIPNSNTDFSNWFENLATFYVGTCPGLGLSASDISAITAQNTACQGGLAGSSVGAEQRAGSGAGWVALSNYY